MNEDLGAVVRGIAREEGVAAELDRPYDAALRDRYVRDVRRRRAAGVTGIALVAAVVVGGGALGADRLTRDVPPVDVVVTDPTPSWTPSPTWEPTPSETPTATPTVTATETPTPTDTPTTPPPAPEPEDEETTPPPPPPPPPAPTTAPTGVYAVEGGGSGEVLLLWDQVPGATGYRVYRASASGGPFVLSASYDVVGDVVTVALDGYEYIWIDPENLEATRFRYTEAIRNEWAWFRVSAFTAGGEGPTSGTVCGGPVTATVPRPADC